MSIYHLMFNEKITLKRQILAWISIALVKNSFVQQRRSMAEYWKKYYNTELGAGTVEEFIENFPTGIWDMK